jgi:hypothetical protein
VLKSIQNYWPQKTRKDTKSRIEALEGLRQPFRISFCVFLCFFVALSKSDVPDFQAAFMVEELFQAWQFFD